MQSLEIFKHKLFSKTKSLLQAKWQAETDKFTNGPVEYFTSQTTHITRTHEAEIRKMDVEKAARSINRTFSSFGIFCDLLKTTSIFHIMSTHR